MTHLLELVDKISKYEMDLASIVGDTSWYICASLGLNEQIICCPRTRSLLFRWYNLYTQIFIQENAFENVDWTMSAILVKGQYVIDMDLIIK